MPGDMVPSWTSTPVSIASLFLRNEIMLSGVKHTLLNTRKVSVFDTVAILFINYQEVIREIRLPLTDCILPPPTLRLWACCTEVTLCSHQIGHENLLSLVLEIDAPLFPTIIVSNLYFKVLIIYMDLLSISVRNVTCLCSSQGCLSCIEMLPNLMLHSVTPKVSLDTCPWEVS